MSDGVEEVLDQGPRWRPPRWVSAAGVLVVAGVVAAVIAAHVGGHPRAEATAPAGPSASVSSRPTAFAATVGGFVPGGADIDDVAVVGDAAVVLARGSLVRVTAAGGELHPGGGSRAGLPFGDPREADWTLISDAGALWAVSTSGRIHRIDPASLRIGPMIFARAAAGPATYAALGAHLYVDSSSGVYDLAPNASALSAQPVTRGGPLIAADPSRNRLLLVDHDDGWRVRAYSVATGTTVAGPSLPFAVTSVVAAGGAIWVAGTSDSANGRPVLARLDPATLRVAARSDIAATLSAAPTLVAGQSDLWVRSIGQLWCVDAQTGAVAQHWPDLPGHVASHDGQAFVADIGVVGRLRLDASCTG